MAIPGQQNIQIGQPNDPANSDSLYTAFRAVQNNFTTLFNTSSPINTVLPGIGIAVDGVSNTSNSTIKIINTGVTSLVAGNNVTITTTSGSAGSNGALVISATGGGGGGGGVTSVGVSSATLDVTNSPIIGSGNITVNLPNIANLVAGNYSTPNLSVDSRGRITAISNGVPIGVTSVAVSGGSGISVSGSPITSNGTITVTNTGVTSIVAGTGIVINQSNGAVTVSSTGGGGGGSGTVTRVGVVSNSLSVSGSPIVSSGNISIELPNNIVANSVTANNANIANIVSSNIQSTGNSTTPVTSTVYTAGTASHLQTRTSRGNISVPAAVITGDTLLRASAAGYTSFGLFQNAGSIDIVANGAPANSSSAIPSDIVLRAAAAGNTFVTLRYSTTGQLTTQGSVINRIANNSSALATSYLVARSRGTVGTPTPVQVGDSLYRQLNLGYTGNGLISVDGVPGYTLGSVIESIVTAVPTVSGGRISSNVVIQVIDTSNTSRTTTFASSGNLTIPGVYIGNASGLTAVPGANVTGAVPFAAVANSVALANVGGAGNVAAINLNGNGAQVLAGNGAWITNETANGTVTSVSGNGSGLGFQLSGTVTASGNLTLTTPDSSSLRTSLGIGNVASTNFNGVSSDLLAGDGNWLAAGTLGVAVANTVIESAQPNITSVGTLTSLSVSGTISGNGSGLTNIPAANLSGSVNNNISVSATANTTATVGNVVSITINGVTYQLLAL